MSELEGWRQKVAQASRGKTVSELERPIPGVPGQSYPLLVPSGSNGSPCHQEWKLRLVLRDRFEPKQLESLLDGVDQVLWLGSGELQVDTEVLTLEAEESESSSLLTGSVRRVSHQGREWRERTLRPDLQVLRNVSEIRRLRKSDQSVQEWVVQGSVGTAEQPAETLIEETLIYLTGALGGATVLEVQQFEGEDLVSLWPRLNILRVLKWEAGLGQFPSPCEGAGLFETLEDRLA